MPNTPNASQDVKLFVEEQFQSSRDYAPLLTQVIKQGIQKGFHRRHIWHHIIECTKDQSIQKMWSHWASLDDREEIRLRLKALNECGVLDESLVEFVLFFFRASDPVLYQLSAVIAGREIENYPAIKTYLHNYCKLRNIPFDQPVALNNQRSRRRVVLVLSSRRSFYPKDSSCPFPFLMNEPGDRSDADISILFSCCSILLDAGDKECRSFALQLLNARCENGRTIRDRNLVRNAGLLMTRLKASGEKAGDLFHAYFDLVNTQYRAAANFSAHLQALFLLDELMETSVHLGLAFTGIRSDSARITRFNRFLKTRLQYWSHMVQQPLDVSPEDGLRETGSVIERILKTDIQNDTGERYRVFAESVYILADPARWRTQSTEERAYTAFYLIDFSIHVHYFNDEEVTALLQANKLISEMERFGPGKKRLSLQSVLAPVMRRMIELEPSLTRNHFDPQLIHKLSDYKLLPALIPTGTDPDFLPVLADAVEHQVRLQLAINPEFNPDHFFYQLTIRKPSTQFYRSLLELSSGREYKRTDGELFDFQGIVHHLLADMQAGSKQGENVRSLFWTELETVRLRLAKLRETGNPIQLLKQVEAELRGTGAEQLRGGVTLHDLLEIVQPQQGVWYRSGEPSLTSITGREIIERDQILADRLPGKIEKLYTNSLDDEFEAGEAVQSIHFVLDEIEEELLPLLGAAEETLFEGALASARQALDSWMDNYKKVADIWLSSGDRQSSETRNSMRKVLREVDKDEAGRLMAGLVFNTFLTSCFQKGDSWLNRYNLLTWAAGSDAQNSGLWKDELVQLWKDLAEEAMEKRAEARVNRLLKAQELQQVRRHEEVKPALAEIRSWCFSRYDFHHALQCNRELSPSKNPFSGIVKTAGQYTGYFARVWLALLAGVIFMFDFGDAWTELAEIGDFGGVLFVFILGVAGTFLYVWIDLRNKTEHIKGDPFVWVSTAGRVGLFVLVTFVYTALMVALFWYMFSSTEQVVHGEYALLHMLSWTGFALFVGVFLGLIGRD